MGTLDKVQYKGKKLTVAKSIMSVKVKWILLFAGIEQGSGNNEQNSYVYFKVLIAAEARKWIRKKYGKELLAQGEEEYIISLPEISIEEQ